jgi:hypothetical protein
LNANIKDRASCVERWLYNVCFNWRRAEHSMYPMYYSLTYMFINYNNYVANQNPIFLLEFDLTETNNATSFAWHIELCPDKLTLMVVWELAFVSK